MSPDSLRCDVVSHDRSGTVRLVGDLDLATAGMFSARCDQLLADGVEHLVIDLRAVTFMDSSGLGAILNLHRAVGTSARLEIIDGPDQVQRLFTLTGLRSVLQFVSAPDAADPHPV